MPSRLTILLLAIVILAVIIPNSSTGGGAYAFGAGNIPGFAYLEGKAFRHGDIEDILAELLKKSAGGGLLGFGGSSGKFGALDVKRVYFGNWLRDYSQAVDIASLKQVQLQTILNIITVLGFLSNGYATGAFEVTPERLGTYLPVEHIDNPKGYGEGEDPRKYHPKLRGPVHPQEYAVDPSTGMKNYIANESGFWDTSKAHVRRLIESSIHYGRTYRQSKNQNDKFESYRHLGSALHTMEDFFAHSNFCELALISIGGWDVFPHVGANTKIRAPNGHPVYPLVTGTFGGSDFIYSLLGEATDHISQTSIEDLSTQINNASQKRSTGSGSASDIKNLASKIPGLGGGDMNRDVDNMERSRAGASGKNPNDMDPQEIRNAIWPILVFRDNLVTKIEMVIEKIPGLQAALESLMESIQVFVLTALEPFIRPLITTATQNLTASSGAVINNHDQFEVFNDPNCSDPTHSFLSKDHFTAILNEPAGNLAKIVVLHAVPLITAAWDNPSANVRGITEDILQCLFHPDWHDRNSKIQVQLMSYMGKWMNSHGSGEAEVQRRLGKACVRNHENVRFQGQVQGVLSVGATPSGGGGGSGGSNAGISGAIDMLGKLGISNPMDSGSKRGMGGGGEAAGYFNSGPTPPAQGMGYPQPPVHHASLGPGAGYGGAPAYPSPGAAPAYAPPSGPPPLRADSYPVPRGGPPAFPSTGGPGFPSAGRHPSGNETKEEKRARKSEEKKHKKERKHKHENWDDKDYRHGKSSDEDSSDDENRVRARGATSPPGFPSAVGHGGNPLHAGGYRSGQPAGGFPSHPGGGAPSYAPPPGPPPGNSSYYSPPPGPPPMGGGSSYGSMPSGPAGPPAFPPAPGFGGSPGFPSGGNMMPSAFPGMPYGGGGYAPPPGPPPPFPGSGPGFPGGPGGGSGYPGAGGRHQYDGGSSGW